MASRSGTTPPWKRKNPKSSAKKKTLTASERAEARARARKAGRPYPNLVDNMAVARKRKSTRKRKTAAVKKR